jgi:membrane associated rhomboid family serine protease
MLLPIGHEKMSARRLPVITLALIALNVVVFISTNDTIQQQSAKLGEVKTHLLLLAASHPDLTMPDDAQQLVTKFRDQNQKLWLHMQDGNREVVDGWDARIRMQPDEDGMQQEMDSLTSQYSQLAASALTEQYAFIPAQTKPITYVTANFLHGGWLHLIGNMWFLWLAGFVLEDAWGRPIYALVYFISGAAALQFHSWMNPDSMVATLGASGAVAALMGAFLVRFPTLKIKMAWLLSFRILRFNAAAYWLLPLWLGSEVFSGALFGQHGGIAHWAHVGGFVFGACIALLLKVSGLEHKLNEAVESKISLGADPELLSAGDLLEANKIDEALAKLKSYSETNPNSVDAWLLLQQAHWRKNDMPAYQESVLKLCGLHLKARDFDAAWQDRADFVKAGGTLLPAALWFELCRAAEGQEDFERAVKEYGELLAAYPNERQALLALINSARICLTKLGRPQDALALYEAAASSLVPHLDFDQTIEKGKREAKEALASSAVGAAAGAANV